MKAKLTYDLAHAAGTDAGNRSMKKRNAVAWNVDDYNVAVAEMNRLLSVIESEEAK